ncbi:MAG: 50S ribosomal protein L4 [Firmicutes bacterium]|nr:50S ribosomal protein L4 [Bacillota bacterium]
MPKVAIQNQQGEQVGELELNATVFAAPVNQTAIHQAVVAYQANQRRGTASTKTRGEVRGGGRKPWRQKGTGRARHGTSRSPIWVGGGTVFGPNPRDYTIRLPKKIRRLALKSALTVKVNDSNLIVLDQLSIPEPKTAAVADILKNLQVTGKTLLVTAGSEPVVYKSARNIPGVVTSSADSINTYDIVNSDTLIVTRDAVARIEEVFA